MKNLLFLLGIFHFVSVSNAQENINFEDECLFNVKYVKPDYMDLPSNLSFFYT
ncbi:MAG: hypothetical protein P8H56_13240 [Crocinitomicaceae bacterium]|nr:hypothetical protein [Crocinitomicaceae bacterium]MDG1659537.1 hypothetical protein [Crocinitomicaceae bacterium]